MLWPPQTGDLLDRRDLILLWKFAGKRILVADPGAVRALAFAILAKPELRCDIAIWTGTERGAGDNDLRLVAAPLGVTHMIWCGRGTWAHKPELAGEFNTADGAVSFTVDARGELTVEPASPVSSFPHT